MPVSLREPRPPATRGRPAPGPAASAHDGRGEVADAASPTQGRRTPAARRAVQSQTSVSTRERDQPVDARPLHRAAASPSSTPVANRHQRTPSRGPYGESPIRPSATHDGQAGADVVAVADQRGERGEHEQRGEDVEHAHPGLHVRQPVADQQHPGDRRRAASSGSAGGRPGSPAARTACRPAPRRRASRSRRSRTATRRSRSAACPAAGARPARSPGCPRRRRCAASARPAGRSASRRRPGCRRRSGGRAPTNRTTPAISVSVSGDHPAAQPVGRRRRAEPEPRSGGRAGAGRPAQRRLGDLRARREALRRPRSSATARPTTVRSATEAIVGCSTDDAARTGARRPGRQPDGRHEVARPRPGGRLVLAATPLGDARDASPRLRRRRSATADVVAAEDTRRLRVAGARRWG